jgi:hypothetical protein
MSAPGEQTELGDHLDLAGDRERPDCREDLTHLRYRNTETGETAPYRCQQWECACCGHRMKMNLLESIDRAVEERPELSRLLTLTTDPSRVPGREAAHRQIGEAWNRLRSYIQASYGDFSYIWVREDTDAGYPHLHVLVSRFLPQSDVSAAWSRTGMGEVVDIRRVEARKPGRYVAKYLAKDAMAHLPSGAHRYGSSADIELQVRGGGGDDDTPWILEAEDRLTGVMTEAAPGDFIRREPDPPPSHSAGPPPNR